MKVVRTYNGKQMDEARFKALDLDSNQEIRSIYSAVMARLERERKK